jgi:hypothetical protein
MYVLTARGLLQVIVPFGAIFQRNQSHPDGCYLQNAAGQLIDVDGTPVKMNGLAA